jgi:putative acetyltransferase
MFTVTMEVSIKPIACVKEPKRGRANEFQHCNTDKPIMSGSWTVHEGELDQDDVRALLAQHFAEMRAGSPPSACHVLPADGLKSSGIRFFTLREGDNLLGCGALKRLEPGHGELKSMRTSDAVLGRGVGKAILDHLVAIARDEGMTRLSLETGSTEQFAAANRLYEREGFQVCGPFGGYVDTPFTRFFTKTI